MAQVLERTKKSVIVEFTTKEFKKFREDTFDEDNLDTYDIVFEEPVSPKILLETIRKYG
ncbi:MAG: hypothetical protein LBF15_01090 [Candidatus Peribacteria bacterium]|jgi:hypothetical protein|nr:hypothetical protein [Candidatus Peribacteria bacterium]